METSNAYTWNLLKDKMVFCPYVGLVIVIGPSGVIARVISKSDEREARGRFEITSTITP